MGNVCLGFTLGSERNDFIRAPVHFCHLHSSTRLSPLPSLSTQPPAQDNCKQITLFPAFPASRLSFSLRVSLFFRTLGNDDRLLAAAARHQYALNTSLNTFLSIFADIFLTIFLYV
jgi:hypothetical protein